MVLGGRQPGIGLVGNQIGGDHAQAAGGGQIPGERVDAVVQHRIPVRHHHRVAAGGADRLDRPQGVAHPDAGCSADSVAVAITGPSIPGSE